jgi:hypothetical protein
MVEMRDSICTAMWAGRGSHKTWVVVLLCMLVVINVSFGSPGMQHFDLVWCNNLWTRLRPKYVPSTWCNNLIWFFGSAPFLFFVICVVLLHIVL